MAAKRHDLFHCPICGIIVEGLHAGGGKLVCCGKPMDLLEENTIDAATEKHVPVITKEEGGYRVVVGDVEHPMEDDHYIEWIELLVDGNSFKHFLKPGEKPEAFFPVSGESIVAREYCNLHGHWKAEA